MVLSRFGLQENDTVSLYQIVGWDDTNGWTLTADYDDTDGTEYVPATILTSIKAGTVTYAMASHWAGTATNTTAVNLGTDNKADSDGVWTVTNTDPGLYMALVTSSVPGVIYNPIILGNDYYTNHYQGIYELTEETAPAGYIKDPTARYIVIDAYTEDITTSEEGYGQYTVECLVHYTVRVGEGAWTDAALATTADYVVEQKGTTGEDKVTPKKSSYGDNYIGHYANSSADKGRIVHTDTDPDAIAGENLGKIRNTRGVELPSTGGMLPRWFKALPYQVVKL